MTFDVEISVSDFPEIQDTFDAVKVMCQAAMANRFATIVDRNFGFSGEARPETWPILSYDYAKKFHDGQRIPTLQLTDALRQSIQIDDNSHDAAVVWTDCPYAADHQFGNPEKNLPARPFFPMDSAGFITPYAEAECLEACANELNRQLS